MSNTLPVKKRRGSLLWLENNFENIFLALGILSIIFLICLQTFYRYFYVRLNPGTSGFAWTEELARFVFIWITYLAVPVGVKHRSMIKVDIIVDLLNKKAQNVLGILVDFLLLLYCGAVFYGSISHLQMLLKYNSTSAGLQIPYFYAYLILPIGFGLAILRLVQDLVKMKKEGCTAPMYVIAFAAACILLLPVAFKLELGVIIYIFGYLALFLAAGVPVPFSLGLSALFTITATEVIPFNYITQISFTSLDSTPVLSVPLFIVAGAFMGAGGLSRRLIDFCDELVGGVRGGIAIISVLACMLFAAMSGSGPATVAAVGGITIPAMLERGYDKGFSAAIVACAGAIGVLIPPSNPDIFYGISASESIPKMFLATVIPGILIGLALMVISYFKAKKNGWDGIKKSRTIKSVGHSFLNAIPALLVPVIILGGIYSGICTPTEAAGIAAFYSLIVGIFIYRDLNSFKKIWDSLTSAMETSGTCVIIMAMASIFGNILAIEKVPTIIAESILHITDNKILILFIINILLLIVGCFMETASSIIILTPILLPLVTKVGVDPIHFGAIMVTNLAIGMVTPPVGVNLFVGCTLADVKIEKIAKAVVVPLCAMLGILMLVTYIPAVSTWLPAFVQ